MSNFKLLSLAAACVLTLAACGGGGSGPTTTPTPSNVSLSGTAAKGILIGADVKVYSLVDGVKGTSPLGTTTTNANGEFVLSLTPTSHPLLIEVTANGNTKMLNETGTLTVDDEYPQEAAPTDLVLRSFATEATKTTEVRVNPFTEMAVAVAGSVGALTLKNLVAGQEVAKLATPKDVNPFNQIPLAKPADMDDGQMKFAMQMAGLLKAANDDSSCALKCQIGRLSEGVEITVANNGSAIVPPAKNLAIQEKKLALLSVGRTALKVDSATESKKETIANAVVNAVTQGVEEARTNTDDVTTPDTESVIAANDLEGFVTALRDGFRLTETRLLKVEEDLNKRYETTTLNGLDAIGTVLNGLGDDCNADDGFVCSTSDRFTWTEQTNNGYSWATKTADSLGRASTGTLTVVEQTGGVTVSLNGSVTQGNKTLVGMNNLILTMKEDEDERMANSSLNGTVRVYDSSSDLTVDLKFNALSVGFERLPDVDTNEYANTTLKGGLSLETSLGDKLTGSLDMKIHEVGYRVPTFGDSWYMLYDDYIQSGIIDLKAVSTTSTSNVAGLNLVLSSSLPDYTKPEGPDNFETYSGTVKLILTDNFEFTFNEASNAWSKVSQSATIKSGGSEVKMTMDFLSSNTTGSWCKWNEIKRCTNEIKLTSTNEKPYNSTLTKDSNGKTKGDVMLGTIKVGEFANGVLKINGEEISLY